MGGSISTDDGEAISNQKLASLGFATVKDGIVSTSAPTDMGFVKAENSQIKYNGLYCQRLTHHLHFRQCVTILFLYSQENQYPNLLRNIFFHLL